MPKIAQVLIVALVAMLVLLLVGDIDAAFAQYVRPVRGVPGPIAGAGLPIIAVAAAAYWLVRRYRPKKSQ
jgi:hypothetical protein